MGLPGVTLVLVGGPILTQSSNPALHRVNLEVDGLRERRETVEGTQSGQEETGSKKMKSIEGE